MCYVVVIKSNGKQCLHFGTVPNFEPKNRNNLPL